MEGAGGGREGGDNLKKMGKRRKKSLRIRRYVRKGRRGETRGSGRG